MIMTWFKFEGALRDLVEYYPEEDQKKPSLFHSIRVWTYLYNNWYSEDLQIAGLLHDAIEDTPMPKKLIEEKYWENILKIVIANSKEEGMENEDVIKKCVSCWEDALIVKMADVYDNFVFYIKEWKLSQIARNQRLSKLILRHKPNDWEDKIFERADEILSYDLEQ